MLPCCLLIHSKSLHLAEKLPQLTPKIPLQYFLFTMNSGYTGRSASLTASGEVPQTVWCSGERRHLRKAAPSTTFLSRTAAWRKLFSSHHTLPVSGLSGLLVLPFLCASLSTGSPSQLYSQWQMWLSKSLGKYEPPNEKPTIHSGTSTPMGVQALTPVFIFGI